jgi:hypothetical protein
MAIIRNSRGRADKKPSTDGPELPSIDETTLMPLAGPSKEASAIEAFCGALSSGVAELLSRLPVTEDDVDRMWASLPPYPQDEKYQREARKAIVDRILDGAVVSLVSSSSLFTSEQF